MKKSLSCSNVVSPEHIHADLNFALNPPIDKVLNERKFLEPDF